MQLKLAQAQQPLMSFTHQLQLGRAIGSKRYNDAIALLQKEIDQATPESKGLDYSFFMLACCHQAIGGAEHFGLAVKAAQQALKIDTKFFDAHRLLTDLYSNSGEHVLGTLHARNAIKYAKPPARVPVAAVPILYFMLLILRGREAAVRFRESAAKDHHTLWLAWAKDYLEWNEQRGTLLAANQLFRPAPRPK